MRVHLILSHQKIFNSIVCMEVSLASFTFPPNLALSPPILRCVEVVQKNRDEEVWGSVCDSMQIQLCSLFAWEARCNFRLAPSRMCVPLEQRVLFRVGPKAVAGSVGYGKFNRDRGICARRNNVHVSKRHCQNAT